MRNLLLASALGLLLLPGCGSSMVTVSQMMPAPARPASCPLELVSASMMELSPMSSKWDFLGIVAVSKSWSGSLDPNDPSLRALIRPKACGLGGTSVALMQNATSNAGMGSSSAIMFAVLRPKQAPAAPTPF